MMKEDKLMTNYAKAFEVLLKQGETIENLNTANHLALERKEITLKEFQEAAQILVREFLKR